jgi:hypothetical protein
MVASHVIFFRGDRAMASDALMAKKLREQGGAQAFRAFDFQLHASMARILEAYRNGESFSAFFDHFDDLVVLHEEGDEVAICFYQVKARAETAWTANRLASRPSKALVPKSIIGKAYNNLHEFGQLTRKAAIISNQHLQARSADGSKTSADSGEILLSSLSADEYGVLVAALEADFPGGIDPRHTEVLVYERIPLDLQSFRQTLLGLVIEFVESIGPDYVVTAKPLYDALLSEISRCTGTVASAKTLAELKRQKSLGHLAIGALVERVRQRTQTPLEWWQSVETEMVGAGLKSLALRRLRLACLDYWRARERGNLSAIELSGQLVAFVRERADLLGESIHDSLVAYETICLVPEPVGQPYTRRAALLVEILDAIE